MRKVVVLIALFLCGCAEADWQPLEFVDKQPTVMDFGDSTVQISGWRMTRLDSPANVWDFEYSATFTTDAPLRHYLIDFADADGRPLATVGGPVLPVQGKVAVSGVVRLAGAPKGGKLRKKITFMDRPAEGKR